MKEGREGKGVREGERWGKDVGRQRTVKGVVTAHELERQS